MSTASSIDDRSLRKYPDRDRKLLLEILNKLIQLSADWDISSWEVSDTDTYYTIQCICKIGHNQESTLLLTFDERQTLLDQFKQLDRIWIEVTNKPSIEIIIKLCARLLKKDHDSDNNNNNNKKRKND